MEENNIKKYLTDMHKIIKSSNPKYMSFVSKEYIKYSKINPMISDAIGDMIYNEVNRNSKSPYSVFMHDNGKICLDAISDISKITNVAEFIKQVEALSKVGIDFSEITADDLIIEGDQIAEEISKQLEKEDLTETEIEQVQQKANTSLAKIGILATIGGTISGTATAIFTKLKEKIIKIKNKKEKLPEKDEIEHKKIILHKDTFDEVCPRVNIDEEKVIEEMKAKKLEEPEKYKNRNTDTYGDGDPDGDDIDL